MNRIGIKQPAAPSPFTIQITQIAYNLYLYLRNTKSINQLIILCRLKRARRLLFIFQLEQLITAISCFYQPFSLCLKPTIKHRFMIRIRRGNNENNTGNYFFL